MSLLRVSFLRVAAAAAFASGALACSPSSSSAAPSATEGGVGGSGGGGTGDVGGSGGGVTGGVGGSGGGVTGGVGGGVAGSGGNDGPVKLGQIHLTQGDVSNTFNYTVSAGFAALTGGGAKGGPPPTSTTIGDCTATVLPTPPAPDAGTPMPQPPKLLNAGAITVAGAGIPASVVLEFAPIKGAGFSNYAEAMGDSAFFAGGDTLTVSGAGGPDLPSFAAQTLVAPSGIKLTSPSCSAGCPDVDRTNDLVVSWTGGGAGKVTVTFETISDTALVLLECKFAAAGGTGTVPTALLQKLEKAGSGGVTGVALITPNNEVTFPVGDALTTFHVQWAQIEWSLVVAK